MREVPSEDRSYEDPERLVPEPSVGMYSKTQLTPKRGHVSLKLLAKSVTHFYVLVRQHH